MNANARNAIVSFLLLLIISCNPDNRSSQKEIATNHSNPKASLPYLGPPDVEFNRTPEGELIPDTIYYSVPKFSFINQDGIEISHHDYAEHIYLADYFFTSCPSICPVINSQLIRIQEMLKKENLWGDVKILSHTVDPDRDTPEVLKEHAVKIGADTNHWNFVTGEKEDLYIQAQEGYFLTAFPSDTADGGFFHSDQVLLIDRDFHIRGTYDGTSTAEMDQLFNDIKILINEQPPTTVAVKK